jgi:hypothetical protein
MLGQVLTWPEYSRSLIAGREPLFGEISNPGFSDSAGWSRLKKVAQLAALQRLHKETIERNLVQQCA